MNREQKKIVVLADGYVGWMIAAYLRRAQAGNAFKVEVIERPGSSPVPYATVSSSFKYFNARCGIDEKKFVKAVRANICYGVRAVGDSVLNADFIFAPGRYGIDIEGHPLWKLLLQAIGADMPQLEAFSLSASLARGRRFLLPSADPKSIRSQIDYGYTFSCDRAKQFYRHRALSAGAIEHSTDVVTVEADELGLVRSITNTSGLRVQADFCIDATSDGAESRSCGKFATRDYTDYLPFDEVIAVRGARPEPQPFVEITSPIDGVICESAFSGSSHRQYYFDSHEISAEDVLTRLQKTDQAELCQYQRANLKKEFIVAPWCKNILQLGQESVPGFILDLSSASLAQWGIATFERLLPAIERYDACAREFNRLTQLKIDQYIDLASFIFSRWTGSPMTENMRYRCLYFENSTRIAEFEDDILSNEEWVSLFLGYQICPQLAESDPDRILQKSDLSTKVDRVQSVMRGVTDGASSYKSFWSEFHGEAE